MNIPLFKPNLGEEELSLLREIFKTGWIGLGPKTAEFENAICAYQKRKYAVGMNSCTAALHLALEVLILPEGAEVIIPAITFVSTAHAVEYNRLKVVFSDVREDNLCMDVDDFESKITPRTKAVIPVHLGGQPCRLDEICRIADEKGLIVIEDVANALGGEWQGKKLGSWGHMGALSFEAKKNMTTGDGGMLIFDNEQWLEHLKKMRWVGMNKDTWKRFAESNSHYSWDYDIDCLGFKYNMNDIAACLGLCQLKKLDYMNERKRVLIKQYIASLEGIGDIFLPTYDLEHGGYWLFIIHTHYRDKLMEFLSDKGITCGVHFKPIHLHPYYRERYPGTRLHGSESVWKRIISLPLYASMSNWEQDYVIECIREFFRTKL